jgi:hypothetical protein
MKKYILHLAVLLIVLFVASCGSGGGGGGIIIPTGSATLSWTPPTKYNDGTLLTVAGFKVHYGTSPGHYTLTINIARSSAATYTVTGLRVGATYYFVVTAYDASGVESAPSNEMSKKI